MRPQAVTLPLRASGDAASGNDCIGTLSHILLAAACGTLSHILLAAACGTLSHILLEAACGTLSHILLATAYGMQSHMLLATYAEHWKSPAFAASGT